MLLRSDPASTFNCDSTEINIRTKVSLLELVGSAVLLFFVTIVCNHLSANSESNINRDLEPKQIGRLFEGRASGVNTGPNGLANCV